MEFCNGITVVNRTDICDANIVEKSEAVVHATNSAKLMMIRIKL